MTRRKHSTKDSTQPVSPPAPPPASPGDRLRPWLLGGAMALFVARPFYPSESAAAFGDGLTIVMLWLVLAVFWLLGAIGRPRFSFRFGWPDAAVLLLLAWHTAAALWATKHGAPRPAINMLWEWIGLGLCFLLTRQFLATAREARAMVAVMLGLAVALAGYGLYHRAYEMPQTRRQYEADPDRELRAAGQWLPPGSPERKLFESRLGNREPTATFALTNSLAAFLSPWLVMLVGMGISMWHSRPRLCKSHGTAEGGCATRFGMLLCLLLIAACLLLTKSRSGYIASGLGLVLVWLFCRGQPVRIGWKLPLTAVGAAALVVAAALAIEGPEILANAWKSFGFRVQYWQSSVQMIADHPLLGCGPGNFQNAYTQYKLPQAAEVVADPHDFLLEIAATAGLPAVLAFVSVIGCFFAATWPRGKVGEDGTREEKLEGGSRAAGSGFQIQNLKSKITNAQPLPSFPDGWPYVLAGGAAGFLLSVPLGRLSAAPPSAAAALLGLPLVTAVLVGLPLAMATVGILWGWIRDGRLPRLLPAVGIAVLLVDLLTTGGIGMPGVAGTLWLLLALGLEGERPRVIRAAAAWAALLVAIGLVAACYYTAYDPVLGCQVQLQMAEREPARAVEHLEAAAAADPWSAEPWRQLAAIEFDAWSQAPNADGFRRFERASAQFLALAPNAAPAWAAAGDWYFSAYSRMAPRRTRSAADALAKAIDAYSRAVVLYPNSEAYRAKLAEARRVKM